MVALVGQNGQAVVMGKREKRRCPLVPKHALRDAISNRTTRDNTSRREDGPRLGGSPPGCALPHNPDRRLIPKRTTMSWAWLFRSDRDPLSWEAVSLSGTAPCLPELSRRTMCSLTSTAAMIRYLLFCFSANQVNHLSSLLQTSAGCARAQPSLRDCFSSPRLSLWYAPGPPRL